MTDTFQSLIDEKAKLRANCGNPTCMRSAELDLVALRDKYGPDGSAMHADIAHKLRCTKCGDPRTFLTVHVDTAKPSGWVNPYIKAKGG